MKNTYVVPVQALEVVTEVKKSRFIARVEHIKSKEEARAYVEAARKDYPDARHHCWAYLLGNPFTNASAAMNDDGEPSGTAGKPILNVIQHKGIGDVIVVVIRYFGGIKLGAGGLTRAYSGAAESVLSQVKLTQVIPSTILKLEMAFNKEQPIRHWLNTFSSTINTFEYRNSVLMTVSVPNSHLPELKDFCRANNIKIG